MFEVGSDYKIVMLESSENYQGQHGNYESSSVYEVAAVDGTLVKLLGPDFSDPRFNDFVAVEDRNAPRREIILNTASLFFVRAEKVHKLPVSTA